MTDTQKDEKAPHTPGAGAEPQTPANDPGPEAMPAEPEAPPEAGMPRAELEARFAALAGELAEKTAELAAFKDSALRQLADHQNQRRRAENEMAEMRKYGAAHFARDTLAMADNLRRALSAAGGTAAASPAADQAARAQMFDSLRQGVELIEREFAAILERHGIKRIDPLGEKFDPNWHQAMFEAEAPGAEPGTVMQVVQPGYRLHDRLLRPAMVGVVKAKVPQSDEPKDESAAS
ncbi:MAG TPA: nucleotide exchange factor GrpE [Alphaproteobacteria bacterium]|jgi:molecular chaperone GrpE